jgi:amino acid adenylation domain-containing protein
MSPLTQRLFPGNLIHAGFLQQARLWPERTALIWEEDGSIASMSYRALGGWASKVAEWVSAHEGSGGEQTLVAILLPKGWFQVAAALGVTWSGAAYVPMDVSWPSARIAEVIAQTGCRLMIVTEELRQRISGQPDTQFLSFEEVCGSKHDSPEQQAARWNLSLGNPRSVAESALAYVIYTSGSTGRPKGVMMEHRAVCVTLQEVIQRWGIHPRDRVLALSALSFDLSVFDIFGVLSTGGALIVPSEHQRRDPGAWLRLAASATIWNSVPALLQMAVDRLEVRNAATTWPGPLRLAMLSGDWIPVRLPGRLRAKAPHASVVSLGGATEAAIWSIAHDLSGVDPDAMTDWRSIPYGKALSGQTVQVLRGPVNGTTDLTPCGAWVAGHIYISGGGLARGYWKDPELTGQRFIAHPDQGARYYYTGDLGRMWPDGTIELLGRADRQVKIQGYRVELGEIESALLNHPSVAAATVKAFERPGGTMKLVAYVAGGLNSSGVDVPSLRKFISDTLPPYMIPHIQVVEELPRNSSDKVDGSALPDPVWEQTGAGIQSLEVLRLAAREILNLPELGLDDNLLEMGANSADILAIIGRIEGQLNVEIDIEAFFANPTLRGMLEQPGVSAHA